MRFTQEQIDQAKQVPVEPEKICGGDIQMEHMETALIF